MSNVNEIDQIAQLRRIGIGFIVGGLLFGGLSNAGSTTAVGSVLIGLGAVSWYGEYTTPRTVGIGPGIAAIGVVGALNVPLSLDHSPLVIAGIGIGCGVADLLLLPVYARLRDATPETDG